MLARLSGRAQIAAPRAWRFAVLAVFAAVSVAGGSGCSASCDTSDDGNPPELYTGGVIRDGVYWSAPIGGELLHFPGGKRYEIVHGLGVCPRTYPQCIISFSPDGINGVPNGDTTTYAAGNECEFEAINERSIIIKNATCSEFWVLVSVDGQSDFLCDGGLAPIADAGADAAADAAAVESSTESNDAEIDGPTE